MNAQKLGRIRYDILCHTGFSENNFSMTHLLKRNSLEDVYCHEQQFYWPKAVSIATRNFYRI